MKKILFTAILLCITTFANASETNFSYSTLGVSAGSTNISPTICSGSTCFSNFANLGLSGSYQFNGDVNWLVLSLGSGASKASSNGIDLTASVGSVGINFVKAITNTVDVGGGIASLSSTVKACSSSICASVDDTGVGYFVGANIWLSDAKNLAASIQIDSSKYSKSTSSSSGYGLSLSYYVTKNNALSVYYSSSSNSGTTATSVDVGYAYHF